MAPAGGRQFWALTPLRRVSSPRTVPWCEGGPRASPALGGSESCCLRPFLRRLLQGACHRNGEGNQGSALGSGTRGREGGGEGGETERGREGGRRRECWGTGLKRDLKMISRPRKQALQIGADQKTWRYFFKKINLIQYLTCINILKVVYNQERVGVQLIMKIKQM